MDAKKLKSLVSAVGDGPEAVAPRRRTALVGDTVEVSRFRATIQRVPTRFREHRLATVGQHVKRPVAVEEAAAALEAMLRGEVLALTLAGRSEAGKTSLAAALWAELADRAGAGDIAARRLLRAPMWTDALALSRARSTTALGAGEARLVAHALSASLLVVDELGGETTAGTDELIDVIWRRWQEQRPTIVTTGQPREKLRSRYGDGVVTRLTKQRESRLVLCADPPPKKTGGEQQPLPLDGVR